MTPIQQQALNLIQVLLGMITPNYRRVSISAVEQAVYIQIVLEHESPADREEIEDLKFELDALQSTIVEINIEVVLSTEALTKTDENSMIVYLRKED